jgi:Lectin C-type domain
MKKSSLKSILTIAAIQILSAQAYANSGKLYSKLNGHYYQRFDLNTTSPRSKTDCTAQGGYLATITSQAEEAYIEKSFLQNNVSNYYFINGTDAGSQGKWRWLTGEKWSYHLWSLSGENGPQPSSGNGEDFVLLGPNSPNPVMAWFDVNSTDVQQGYICEWGSDKNVINTLVPDVNKNGAIELATLQVNAVTGNHVVILKDSRTAKTINTLVFATGKDLPQGFVVIKDLNNNGAAEIAVLSTFNQQPAVFIKDTKSTATDGFIKVISFNDKNYDPLAIAVLSNVNATDKITVLSRHKLTKAFVAQMRDSKTGK